MTGINQKRENMTDNKDLLTIAEASMLASEISGKDIQTSNIAYLIQYAKVRAKFDNSITLVVRDDLVSYFTAQKNREVSWKKDLGADVNWKLSFDWVKEKERTKHVHRLHPYKGKFIPQLVEYFLDTHIDDYKNEVFFNPGDVVLDPFCGSGTTLVQANELGIHAIGIDISEFNTLISNVKVRNFDLISLKKHISSLTNALSRYTKENQYAKFEEVLLQELYKFNSTYFPSPKYKFLLKNGEIDEKRYAQDKEQAFLPIYQKLIADNNIKLGRGDTESFIDTWFLSTVRNEIRFINQLIEEIEDRTTRDVIRIILSRTVRSCRATTHSDLATLKDPVFYPYYCTKHFKICKPLFSILGKWKTYSNDTVDRLVHFLKIKTDTHQLCLTGDSRSIDLFESVSDFDEELQNIIKNKRIRGIFSSPPYVGLIDYHEQHAYAYELFGYSRRDELEIGPLFMGQTNGAKTSYIDGISNVLVNCERFLEDDYDIFLVANDKYRLYPAIAAKSGMRIVNTYRRPVLNRTERDKSAYSEEIFHLKSINRK